MVIQDLDKTLNENAIEPWGMSKGTGSTNAMFFRALAMTSGFDPWTRLGGICRSARRRCSSMAAIKKTLVDYHTVGVAYALFHQVSGVRTSLRAPCRNHDR